MEKICQDCERCRKDGTCMVYKAPPSVFVRAGECPFNQEERVTVAKRKRVGQQKQRKRG